MPDIFLRVKRTTDEELLLIENTEVYNIICDSLGIEPKANNGTLRLPLKPIGFHPGHEDEEFMEPQENNADAKHLSNVLDEVQTLVPLLASVVTPTTATEAMGNITSTAVPGTYQNQNQSNVSHLDSSTINNFWDYLSEKIQAIKAWAEAKISHVTNHSTSAQDN